MPQRPDNSYLRFDDVVKRQRPVSFATMVKPVGSACNLNCDYCYYLDKVPAAPGAVMSFDTLEAYIRDYIRSTRTDTVSFVWHGGEPVLAGLGFYRRAVELQHRYAGGRRIENAFQTNGTLLDGEWCRFFRDNNFLVGISVDGPRDIHDRYRRDRGGNPTFDRVMRGLEHLVRHGVEFNTMTAVSRACEGRGRETYLFLKSLGSRFMQFMPVIERIDTSAGGYRRIALPDDSAGSVADWSVGSRAYGEYMCDIFDEWFRGDVGRCFVQLFDVTLAQWMGVNPALCAFCESCGDSLTVERNGDIYPCDRFVGQRMRLGNISTDSLAGAFMSRRMADFGAAKHNGLSSECRNCRWLFACRGECPEHRFPSADGQLRNALCDGYRLFFEHVAPRMRRMAELLSQGRPASEAMEK
ncbi:MAG: anaerobic sulfatase maturase [Alistipes sp.]|nr:anaerobic sulfatase maturase [Alistipes sp.]